MNLTKYSFRWNILTLLYFGDFELKKKIREFGLIDRKLQGLEGEFNYDGSDAYFAVASQEEV